MVNITCSVYEKCDFLELIEYAKKKKIEDCNNELISPLLLKIELDKLESLRQRVEGKYRHDYDMSSRRYSRNHPSGNVDNDDLPKPNGDGWYWSHKS